MFFQFRLVFIVVLSAVATGCSMNHYIAEDYGDYLAENPSENGIPKTEATAEYYLTKQTESHTYSFRAITVGYAQLWIVEFGEILDKTMASDEVRAAFKSITKADASSTAQNVIEFDLLDYVFVDYKAAITLHISYNSNGQIVVNKQYEATGLPQTTQMLVGGAFGMRDAVHDSTKSAIDQILTDFITDINESQKVAFPMKTSFKKIYRIDPNFTKRDQSIHKNLLIYALQRFRSDQLEGGLLDAIISLEDLNVNHSYRNQSALDIAIRRKLGQEVIDLLKAKGLQRS